MRKTALIATILTALAATSAAAPPASATASGPAHTDELLVDLVTVAGCPLGSVGVAGSTDNATVHLSFHSIQVQIGPDVHPTAARKTCQVVLSIHVPDGAAYAIDRVEYGGYAALAPGAVFTQRSRHYRSGQSPQPAPDHSWTGPFDDVWQAVYPIPAEELHFPPCGTNPYFNTAFILRLDAGTSDPTTETSFAGLDSLHGLYGVKYHLQTRPC
ncbi:DUF4360 domain-containing protein [Jidongwangia harbinensis]|uniref:DUF4360 domain-containing protein n=1 Tax=Jidongwangia harbinensis TaxID=2878561 RepID=UPI001CD9A4A4|nr:DUF4360 domain-containing protein [Jidongwangia harbinensis]MCA2218226.1 DUF4360 domain-containing protein [Jidongwangia harbinensis]